MMMAYRADSNAGVFIICAAVALLWPLPYCSSQGDQLAAYKPAKAKFYQLPDGLGTPSGACGYGEYGRSVYSGNVAAVSSRFLYRSGAGCGACYQVKCTAGECNEEGVKVVVTDNAKADEAEFILSFHAFAAMGVAGKEKELRDEGVVEVKYRRVGCDYGGGENMRVKVLDHSVYPYYLAFVFLYQGGSSGITAVEVFEEDGVRWRPCSRAYGAVWRISNPPKNDLTMRVFLPGGGSNGPRWVLLRNAIPTPWTPGAAYDTSVQIP